MQRWFGHDLSSVRIHTDTATAAGAREIGAAAYTIGEHITFAPGRYRPQQPSGAGLLAHELTHVIQQRAGARGAASSAQTEGSRASSLWTGAQDDVAEREADQVAARIASGLPAAPTGRPRITPRPLGLYRAVETACLAPSELPSISSQKAANIGRIVEVPIIASYCAGTGGCAWFVTDYVDIDASSYIAFLGARNPHLTQADIVQLALAAMLPDGLGRPDILTHKPPRFEFEEIKPDSITGRAMGRAKLRTLASLFAAFYLPYRPGVTWSGSGRMPLFTLPGGVEVFLRWHRNRPGLVVYNFCVRGEKAVLLMYGIAAILLAAILILLSRGRILSGSGAPLPLPALASAGGRVVEPSSTAAEGDPVQPISSA